MKKWREMIEAHGSAWPDTPHPATGEPFVTCDDFNVVTERQELRRLPPTRPEREYVSEWDDDGPVVWLTRTDAELAEALAAYDVDVAEYRRTGGRCFAPGATTTTGRFVTASGAWAEGAAAGPRWRWTKWSLRRRGIAT